MLFGMVQRWLQAYKFEPIKYILKQTELSGFFLLLIGRLVFVTRGKRYLTPPRKMGK
jgi:hypothetical protein